MLFDSSVSETSIALRISSDRSLVERAVKACKQFLKMHHVTKTEDIAIVLRELTENAVLHGNHSDPDGVVSCRVESLGRGHFKVVVQDEGAGFDYAGICMTPPDDPRRIRNRGYVLIHSLSERLEFNEQGNCVTAYVVASDDVTQAMKEAHP